MKYAHISVFFILLLHLTGFLHCQAQNSRSPLQLIFDIEKHRIAQDDYKLCMRMLQEDPLSYEELKRLVYVCDTMIGRSNALSKNDIILCREQLEKKIGACDIKEQFSPNGQQVAPLNDVSAACGSGSRENSYEVLAVPVKGSEPVRAPVQTKVVANDVRGVGFTSRESEIQINNQSDGFYVAVDDPTRINDSSGNSSITFAAASSDVTDPVTGINLYTGTGHCRIFTGTESSIGASNNFERLEVNPEGGINLSAGDIEADGDVGLNILVSGSGSAQAATLSSDAASVNIAVGMDAIATSSDNSHGFNFAAQNATATSSGLSNGFNFASHSTSISTTAEHGSVLFALGDDGFGGASSIELNEVQNSFTVATAGSTPVNPKEGVNFYINNFEPVIYKNDASNLRFFGLPDSDDTVDEAVLVIDTNTNAVHVRNSGSSGSGVIPCSDIEANLVVCDGIRTQNGTISNNDTSMGLNVALDGGTAESFSNSAGFNFSGQNATATSSNGSDGFNFAAQDAVATSDDNSRGFNFAAAFGKATSINSSDGFNFAARSGQASSFGQSTSFNFASGGATAISDFTLGFNFASGNTEIENSEVGNNSILFALGDNGISNASSIDLTSNDRNSFTVATAGAQVSNPGEGVNFYINNSGNASSEFRLIDIPSADGAPLGILADGSIVRDTSSKRFKKNIASMSDDLTAGQINRLRPVSFVYKNAKDNKISFGLIAEEVAEICPELVVFDSYDQPFSVKYTMLIPILLKQLQQEHEKNMSHEVIIDKLQSENKQHEEQIKYLQEKDEEKERLMYELFFRLKEIKGQL